MPVGDELHQRVVKRIRAVAREKRTPLSHLPDRAAVSRSHFWEVLGGKASPTLDWLGRVAEALEVDAEELVRRPPRAKSAPGARSPGADG